SDSRGPSTRCRGRLGARNSESTAAPAMPPTAWPIIAPDKVAPKSVTPAGKSEEPSMAPPTDSAMVAIIGDRRPVTRDRIPARGSYRASCFFLLRQPRHPERSEGPRRAGAPTSPDPSLRSGRRNGKKTAPLEGGRLLVSGHRAGQC